MDFIYMKKSGRKRKNVSDYDRGGSGGAAPAAAAGTAAGETDAAMTIPAAVSRADSSPGRTCSSC